MAENNSNKTDRDLPEITAIIQGFKTERECLKNYCERILLIEKRTADGLDITAATLFGDLASDAKLSLANLQITSQSPR